MRERAGGRERVYRGGREREEWKKPSTSTFLRSSLHLNQRMCALTMNHFFTVPIASIISSTTLLLCGLLIIKGA